MRAISPDKALAAGGGESAAVMPVVGEGMTASQMNPPPPSRVCNQWPQRRLIRGKGTRTVNYRVSAADRENRGRLAHNTDIYRRDGGSGLEVHALYQVGPRVWLETSRRCAQMTCSSRFWSTMCACKLKQVWTFVNINDGECQARMSSADINYFLYCCKSPQIIFIFFIICHTMR